MSEGIKLFNDEKVRVKWDSEIEEYYFSVIDVITKRLLVPPKKKRVGTWC